MDEQRRRLILAGLAAAPMVRGERTRKRIKTDYSFETTAQGRCETFADHYRRCENRRDRSGHGERLWFKGRHV
jgi:hypothetical protein